MAASNYTEYVFGTSPNTPPNGTNFWAAFPATNTINAYFAPVQGGRIYQLQSTTNLSKQNWLTLTNQPVISTNASGLFTNGTGYGVFTASFSNAVQTYFRLAARLSTNY